MTYPPSEPAKKHKRKARSLSDRVPLTVYRLCAGPGVSIAIYHSDIAPDADPPPPTDIKFLAFPLRLLISLSPWATRRIRAQNGRTSSLPANVGIKLYQPYPLALLRLLEDILRFIRPHHGVFTPARGLSSIIPTIDLRQEAFYQNGQLSIAAGYLDNRGLADALGNRMQSIARGQVNIDDCRTIYSDPYCRTAEGKWMRDMAAQSIANAMDRGGLRARDLYKRYMGRVEGRAFRQDVRRYRSQ